MAITALPTPPNRNMTPEEFIAAADAFLEALPTFQSEANAAAEAMNLNDTSGTSATSNSIGTGAKTFTANTGFPECSSSLPIRRLRRPTP
jgi:hypothetical protein